ncbi:hypothetical protein PYW07_004160 [Mythimna separata]|uniref:Uncharacterized protein n=1 Tax=Mythimna separata TaxID=271217 RepID=A0AAD7YR01_MYTSE|nr:hypothetical protein PYW07_004160 [Mythimna separata]
MSNAPYLTMPDAPPPVCICSNTKLLPEKPKPQEKPKDPEKLSMGDYNLSRGSKLTLTSPSRLFLRCQEDFGISPVLQKPAPFKLRWMNGYNVRVEVINLNYKGSTTVFYSASNCGVLYNWTTHQMWLLQGHRHKITCIASDKTGQWLLTADSGPENSLIVWDFKDLFPQKTFFNPHGNAKIAKVALSTDAKYMITIAYPGQKMVLYWWIWSYGKDTPHATWETNDIPRDGVVEVGFNPWSTDQFLIMTRRNIYLGFASKIVVVERGIVRVTDNWQLKVNGQAKVKREFGKMLCYTFVKSTSQIIVGTSRGAVIIYGYTIAYNTNVEPQDIDKLRFVKVLKLNKRMIYVIKNVDGVIVTGNSIGEIHFYDDQLKLLYWVHGFTVDRVKGLSFNVSSRSSMILDPKCGKPCPCWEQVKLVKDEKTGETKQKLIKMRLPTDATVDGKPFLVRDFLVCTYNQGVGFVDFATEKYTTILDNRRSPALSLAVHPENYGFVKLRAPPFAPPQSATSEAATTSTRASPTPGHRAIFVALSGTPPFAPPQSATSEAATTSARASPTPGHRAIFVALSGTPPFAPPQSATSEAATTSARASPTPGHRAIFVDLSGTPPFTGVSDHKTQVSTSLRICSSGTL